MPSYYGLLIDFHFKESEDQNRDLLPKGGQIVAHAS